MKLNSKELILKCLKELPDILTMKQLCVPRVYRAQGGQGKDPGGWTGYVIIMESHISIHTFPKRKFVSADVYSCKNGMNSDFIINYFKRKFGLKKIETNFIKRGTSYPLKNIC